MTESRTIYHEGVAKKDPYQMDMEELLAMLAFAIAEEAKLSLSERTDVRVDTDPRQWLFARIEIHEHHELAYLYGALVARMRNVVPLFRRGDTVIVDRNAFDRTSRNHPWNIPREVKSDERYKVCRVFYMGTATLPASREVFFLEVEPLGEPGHELVELINAGWFVKMP